MTTDEGTRAGRAIAAATGCEAAAAADVLKCLRGKT